MTRTLNQGRNALTDALVNGRNIEVASIALGRSGNPFQETQEGLQDAIDGARYTTENRRRATASGRYDATVPATSDADGETLEELVVEIITDDEETAIARIPFAETPKVNGSEIIIETESEVKNQ